MAMNLYQARNMVRSSIKNHGLFKTLYDLTYRAANHLLLFRVLRCMAISVVDPNYLKGNDGYKYMFLNAEMLSEFAKNGEYEISEDFLRQTLAKGDECYGILDGNTLAGYGWYSSIFTNLAFDAVEDGKEDLLLHLGNKYIYMYKGYTHNSYRGQRLHAIGMTRALQEYLGRGFKGLVSYVESNNYSSLKSVYRMGYKDFGKIYIFRIFGKYLIHSSRGCKKYGFWIEKL